MTVSLALRKIRKSFGGAVVLDDADFQVRSGQVHALLGENGAGKSSLMNIAAGLYAPEAGEIVIDDQNIMLGGPAEARQRGIGMVHQHFKLIPPFTIAENILLSSQVANYRTGIKDVRAAVKQKAGELNFELDPARRVDSLTVAQQQQVEIIKVLLAGARIVIFDEPTAVLTDAESEQLLSTATRMARDGAAVVLITHKLGEVKSYADTVTIMRRGRTVATLDPSTTSISELTQLTVGEARDLPQREASPTTDVRLVIEQLTCDRSDGSLALQGTTFSVRGGEIYGVAGVSGNGQAELAEVLMGIRSQVSGEIKVEQLQKDRWSKVAKNPADRIAIIPADRYAFALAGILSLADNFAAAQVRSGAFGTLAFLNRSAMRSALAEAIAEYEIQGVTSAQQRSALLSGGNAQKLVLAREFRRQPTIVVAHSPSRGLDVRACRAVHQRLLSARDRGAAVLLISEDLDEVIDLSDRVGVMTRGRIAAEFDRPADRQKIGQAMVGHA